MATIIALGLALAAAGPAAEKRCTVSQAVADPEACKYSDIPGPPEDMPYVDAAMGTDAMSNNPKASSPETPENDGFDAFFDGVFGKQDAKQQHSTTPAVYNAADRCGAAMINGNIMDGAFPAGDHLSRLTVMNGSGSPAFVKIIDSAQGVIRVMYLAKGGEGAIENIPNGTYDVKFAFGGWLLADCQTLTGASGASEFEAPIRMQATRTVTETPTEFGTEVRTRWSAPDVSVTLFTVPDGKARTKKITLKDFNAD